MSFSEARAFVRRIGLKSSSEWSAYCKNELPGVPPKPDSIPAGPRQQYQNSGWIGMGDWLGTDTVAPGSQEYLPFEEARSFVRSLNLKNQSQWNAYCRSNGLLGKPPKPSNIPATPDRIYKKTGWISMGDWIGTGVIASRKLKKRPFHEARAFVRSLKLSSGTEWAFYCAGGFTDKAPLPIDIPKAPQVAYKGEWVSVADWLGTNGKRVVKSSFNSFEAARSYAQSLKLHSYSEWVKIKDTLPEGIPAAPDQIYKSKGWISWGDWLGTGKVANRDRTWLSFQEARSFVRKLGLKNSEEWVEYCKTRASSKGELPFNIPSNPHRTYKDCGWNGMKDWLGIAPPSKPRN